VDRRRFLLTSLAGAVFTPLAAVAQQAGKIYRLGLVSLGGDPLWWRPFIDALAERGYVEGLNLVVRRAFARGNADELPRLVTELLTPGVDVVIATGPRETRAVKEGAPATPIVMLLVPDPVAEGFVTTLAHPGGRITGLTNSVPGLVQKYVELLREALPSASRFAVVARLGGPAPGIYSELESAAKTFSILVSLVSFNAPSDFDVTLARAKKEGAAGLIVPPEYLTFIHRKRFVETTLKYRLPGIYWAREYVDEGGLLTYAPDIAELRGRAATFVDKILKGTNPADLPVEQPTKFELVVNLKTAKALGLTIPPSLLLRADQIIE
jgi:putative ABC transport system substrate-binding protein